MHLSILLISLFVAATARAGPLFTSSPPTQSPRIAVPSPRGTLSPPRQSIATPRSVLSSSHDELYGSSYAPAQNGRVSRFAHRPPVVLSDSHYADSPPADLLISDLDEQDEPELPYPPDAPSSDGHLADSEETSYHLSSNPMSVSPESPDSDPADESMSSTRSASARRTLRGDKASQSTLRAAPLGQSTLRRDKMKRGGEVRLPRDKGANKKGHAKRDKLPTREASHGLDMDARQDSRCSMLSSSSGSTSTPVALRASQRPLSFTRLLSFERDATGRPQWGGVKQAAMPTTVMSNAGGSNKPRQHELLAQKEAFYNALLEQKWRKMDRIWRDSPAMDPVSLLKDKELLRSMSDLLQDKERHNAQTRHRLQASSKRAAASDEDRALYWHSKAGEQPLVLTAKNDGELSWEATESTPLASRRKRPLSRQNSNVWSLAQERRPVKKRSSMNLSMPTSRLDHIVDEGSPLLDHEEQEWQWANVKKTHHQQIFSDDEGMFDDDPVREVWMRKIRQQIEMLEYEEKDVVAQLRKKKAPLPFEFRL